MTNQHLDMRRHMNLFNPYQFNVPVTVIGAGATGSWLVLQLAKLGISDITVWDFDHVEEHNVPNQLFDLSDVGELKVDALADHIKRQTGLEIKTVDKRFTHGRLRGYVFLMVDSMLARKDIWETSVKGKSAVKLLVEPRMGLNEARVYNVEPTNLTHQEKYEACWYPDDEAEVSACGTSQTVITTALLTASFCARQLINHFNNVELSNEILIDPMYNNIYETRWENS
jgi:molybdopterin/thiamine biosynthesis adenylyltransferase